jgi:hypothetical protein
MENTAILTLHITASDYIAQTGIHGLDNMNVQAGFAILIGRMPISSPS